MKIILKTNSYYINKKIVLILSLIGVLILNSSCAAIYDFYVSKADNINSTFKNWPNGVVIIELEDIKLALQIDNQFSISEGFWFILPIPIMEKRKEIDEKYRKNSTFVIELAMKCSRQDIAFVPKKVYLKIETGEYIQASKYYKADGILSAPNPNKGIMHGWIVPPPFNEDEPHPERLNNIMQSFDLPKEKWIGFRIYFDTPTPNPGTRFSIIIRGLKRSEEDVSVEEIKFEGKKIYRDSISS